ncbi:MAG: hypothetical protein JNN33_01510 [Rhodospirillaceae bacterium]|nr:hypothetical protein [Rhodospirillaceae bacterium]
MFDIMFGRRALALGVFILFLSPLPALAEQLGAKPSNALSEMVQQISGFGAQHRELAAALGSQMPQNQVNGWLNALEVARHGGDVQKAFSSLVNLWEASLSGELKPFVNYLDMPWYRAGPARAYIHRYKVEPYVVAADVYAAPTHVGRGGWTWYTGSSGWMQRAGIESILWFLMEGRFLRLDPCIPKGWRGFEMAIRYRSARYEIKVESPQGVARGIRFAECDGVVRTQRPLRLQLLDDDMTHHIRVTLG